MSDEKPILNIPCKVCLGNWEPRFGHVKCDQAQETVSIGFLNRLGWEVGNAKAHAADLQAEIVNLRLQLSLKDQHRDK